MAENEQDTNPQEEPAQQPAEPAAPEPTPAESAPATPAAPQPAAPEPLAAGQGQVSNDAKNMALLCHILAIFTGFLGPLILWMIKKDDDPFIDEHGKEALNFQITRLIGDMVGAVLTFVCVGVFVVAAVEICNLVFCIIAAIKASKGEHYRYPVSLRLVK